MTKLLGIKECAPCAKRRAAMNTVNLNGSLMNITTGLWAAATSPDKVLRGSEKKDTRTEKGSPSRSGGKEQGQGEKR